MKPNVGMVDTVARFVLGAGIIFVAFNMNSWHWYVVGLLVMISGIARYCPAYSILGIGTCSDEK